MTDDTTVGNSDLESTATLLAKVRSGDAAARERLCNIYLPILKRWARGRLPHGPRDLTDTEDLVQVSLMKVLAKVDDFESRGEGAFMAYLRTVMLNSIRREIQRFQRRHQIAPMDYDVELVDQYTSALEKALGVETLEQYESALMQLSTKTREAVILRLEFGYTFPEVAAALPCNSANAARMLVTRGVAKLAELLS